MDRMESGWLMLGAAPAGWLVGVFFGGVEGYGLPLWVILAGMGLAGWGVPTERRYVAAIGLLVAAFGMALFYDFTFAGGLFGFTGFVYTGACVAAVFATLAGARMAQAVCSFALALAGLLWVFSDLTSWVWQGGNLLTLGGGVTAGIGALRDR